MRFINLLFFILVACSKTHSPQFQMTGFENHWSQFLQEAQQHNTYIPNNPDIIVKLVPDLLKTSGVDGLCETYSNGTPTVSIDTNYWNNVNYNAQHIIFMHELGHCLFGFVHHNEINPDGSPVHLMYIHADAFTKMPAEDDYINNMGFYINDYFSESNR